MVRYQIIDKIKGHVIDGKKLGRKIGFPTANVAVSSDIKVNFGVWLVSVIVENSEYYGVANVGIRPTVNSKGKNILLEVNIFDFDSLIYGKEIEVAFLQFLRDEKRFESVDELKIAIMKDVENAKKIISQH